MRTFAIKQLVLALISAGTASAWVSPSTTGALAVRRTTASSSRFLTATVEPATTTASAVAELEPPYQAALSAAQAKLEQAIPAEYHDKMLPLLSHFVEEYMCASQASLKAGNADESVVGPQAAAERILTGIGYGLKYGMGENRYLFDVSHEAMRGKDPEKENGNEIDFYEFGCAFFRPYMDMSKTVIAGKDNLKKAMDQIAAGENVVFLANHQSEADPQVVSCCLEEAGYPEEAANMVYVAGHKVTTDPLAIPFSMGRNLICIHSKKHINADPETKATKQRQNLRSMKALLDKFKKGGTLMWVAPSGGRDRRDVETGEVPPAPFDSKTIDIFRLYANKSKVKTHYYPFAMVSYDLCPPPDFVEAGVGEQRNVRFVPVGIAVGPEVESVGGLEGRHEFCEHAFETCVADYEQLLKDIEAKKAADE